MGQRKKELIALKGAGLRKGGGPAKSGAKNGVIVKVVEKPNVIVLYHLGKLIGISPIL